MENVRTFTQVGVLRDLVGKGANLGTTKENLAKPMDVCVKLWLKDAKTGAQAEGFVSLPLSQALKKKQISLGALLEYPLSKDNNGYYSIHNEQSEITWHDTKTLSIVNLVKVEITDDELIVL
jgi:D-serine deaminase-like pyridoxal phosphate-dependent protein